MMRFQIGITFWLCFTASIALAKDKNGVELKESDRTKKCNTIYLLTSTSGFHFEHLLQQVFLAFDKKNICDKRLIRLM